ncbi:sulfite exporter TauE/SafE family protein [Halorubrum laminariae]|uniref:Probable membrane transporter protein n=1 Tax=Halorubrum laminariae TaxID=1433523 RepID=A0ABD6C249_9EURY|nr:sulfite exporter TauE/SafE family protein [Halorubrum laminariae]
MGGLVGGFPLLTLLVGIAFLSGVGITTLGPGGIFVTIALYSLTSIPSSTVAGTAHATFIATGVVGSVAYAHSGEIQTGQGRLIATILSLSSAIGAPLGAYLNAFLPRTTFGVLLGVVAMATGGTIIYRERRRLSPVYQLDAADRRDQILLGGIGLVLGAVSGALGVGGPVLAVPVLILIGVPMLLAIAVAQLQSIFIAAFATTGYVLQGDVSLPLAATIGIPLLAGTVVGWKVAHVVNPDNLTIALGVVLIAVGPALAFH